MAVKTNKAAVETRKPVVVVDNAHVVYKVFGTGRKVTGNMARGGLFTKKIRVREVHAVKGVSFTIYEGESVGIIGSNGSGKSSLMRAVAGEKHYSRRFGDGLQQKRNHAEEQGNHRVRRHRRVH